MSGVRPEDAQCIQVVMPQAAWQVYEEFLALRGLTLDRMPQEMQREDDLPTYTIGITDEAMRRAKYLADLAADGQRNTDAARGD